MPRTVHRSSVPDPARRAPPLGLSATNGATGAPSARKRSGVRPQNCPFWGLTPIAGPSRCATDLDCWRWHPGSLVSSTAMETTLVLLKPDAVRRGLIADILGRFERRGFRFRGIRLLHLDRATAEQHYAEHRERPFFGELVDFITGGPIVALALEGEQA